MLNGIRGDMNCKLSWMEDCSGVSSIYFFMRFEPMMSGLSGGLMELFEFTLLRVINCSYVVCLLVLSTDLSKCSTLSLLLFIESWLPMLADNSNLLTLSTATPCKSLLKLALTRWFFSNLFWATTSPSWYTTLALSFLAFKFPRGANFYGLFCLVKLGSWSTVLCFKDSCPFRKIVIMPFLA